jgi:hypothetical protein
MEITIQFTVVTLPLLFTLYVFGRAVIIIIGLVTMFIGRTDTCLLPYFMYGYPD